MSTDHRLKLTQIKRFDQLIAYLRDEMGWPIARDSFDDVDDLFYEFSAEELGIDPKTSAKILEIKRLRPLSPKQPWGIFFVKFEPKKLPVVALRRILGQVALKRRASANSPDRTAWSADDLLFISNYGDSDARQISFAHFSKSESSLDLPTLRVLGWNNLDTGLHLDAIAKELTENLTWPEEGGDLNQWRKSWSDAFKLGHNEVINTAKDLSIRLAELASSIRDRIKLALSIENDSGPLTILMNAFKSSLVNDLDNDSFADMYAQTITYGLLSARISDPNKKTVDDFTSHMRTSPFLRELMETFLKIGGRKGKAGGPGIDFDELGVGDVIQLLDNVNIEAVLRDFGDKNRQEDPVMHFFEGFLQAYDKKIRKDRGVFYTPQPVVSYIVSSVHELLINEFGLNDGLADTTTWGEMVKIHSWMSLPPLTSELGEKRTISPNEPFVQILDPATGTATFLVEVIDIIYRTLINKWKQQRLSESQQLSAWNDYVPKHLLPRLHAFELMMAPYAIAHMKIGLKLSETGYSFRTEERARIYLTNSLEVWQKQIKLPELDALAREAESVNEIKRFGHFTVVLGNPPYSILSGNMGTDQRKLVDRYRFVDGERIKERGALQFEKNIQDDYVKFFALAENTLFSASAAILAYVSNGNYLDASTFRGLRASLRQKFQKIQITDLHGDGTGAVLNDSKGKDENVFDILQGVAIGIYCRKFGMTQELKRIDLGGSREDKFQFLSRGLFDLKRAITINPTAPNYDFSLKISGGALWDSWPRMNDLFSQYSAGIITARDEVVISESREELVQKVSEMINSKLSDKQFLEKFSIPDKKGWSVSAARTTLRSVRDVSSDVRKVAYRPFDLRFIFYNQSLVWGRAYPTMKHAISTDNLLIAVCKQLHKRTDPWQHAFVCRTLGESSLVSNKSKEVTSFFPMLLVDTENSLIKTDISLNILNPNTYFQALEINGDQPSVLKFQIAGYIYAILNSESYRTKFRDELSRDFPRIPCIKNKVLFDALTRIGKDLISQHLLESSDFIENVPNYVGDPSVILDKASWSENIVWLDKTQSSGFMGVSDKVWNYQVGAYKVCQKWLKDRKGRILSSDEFVHFQKIISSLTQSILLMEEIDATIDKFGGWDSAFV